MIKGLRSIIRKGNQEYCPEEALIQEHCSEEAFEFRSIVRRRHRSIHQSPENIGVG